MSNSKQLIRPQPVQPQSVQPVEEIDFEALAESVKTGVDRLISAVRRGNSKQIAFQVGDVSRDLIVLSKACLGEVEQPKVIT